MTSSHRIGRLIVASEIPLPELDTLAEARESPDLHIRACRRADLAPPPAAWSMTWTLPSGEPWLECGRVEGGYLLRFTDLADFFLDFDARHIFCAPGAATPPETVRHLLLDQVVPLVSSLRGEHALHASAVLTPAGVCAFTGRTGAGKSTLAASFLGAGCPVLSDDFVALEEEGGQVLAWPSYPGARLWEDSAEALGHGPKDLLPVAHYTPKLRLVGDRTANGVPPGPRPLARIYVLAREDDSSHTLAIEPLSPRDAVLALFEGSFMIDPRDRRALERELDFLAMVVTHVRVARLRLPSRFESLGQVRQLVLEDLQAACPTQRSQSTA